MSAAIDPRSRFALSRGYRLQWEDAQNAYVLLFPEGLIKLNVRRRSQDKLSANVRLRTLLSSSR